jgi:DNA polymerase-3 subunit alpha
MASFAHLHVHTEYSLLDGMSRMKNLVQHTIDQGMDSLAITDHGAMYGAIEFYRACKAQGVKPIIGMESYLAMRGMTDRDPRLDKDNYHLLLLAENQTGYQNLLKIASASQLEGFYYRPRVDKEFLAEHSEGLVATTGCLAAEIPQLIVQGREDEARQLLGWYSDVFGPDRFYIELQEHDIPDLRQLNKILYDLAPYADIPFVATNDVHYVRREDADAHDVLLCIGTGSLVAEPNRLKFSDNSYYLRSPEEMAQIFGEVPGALENTLKIAKMCNVNLDDTSYKLPEYPVPEGYDAQSYLRYLCEEGLRNRYGNHADSREVQERLEHELRIIHNMGFDDYFLIVWDLCVFAKERDIWWNVRGSGAGSVVAYSLGITNIDPLRNGLIFERFLNPGRVNMPDIDLDYPDDRRSEMIEYCVHKYGEDKVAQIITFGTLGARAAIRDVGRTLDIPLGEVDQLARMIPAIPGKPVSIKQALDEVPDLKSAYSDDNRPYVKNLLDTAMQLEGIARHASTHAAGVLIADKPLVEYTPLNRPTTQGDSPLGSVSQWPMEIVDSIGLLKVDFLGLRTLTIMRKACELIEKYHGIRYDLDNIPYRHIEGDEEYNAALDEAFRLLTRGDTSGVFQVEGAGMTRVLTEMKPSRFEHIIAAISLFRPGPIEYIPSYIRRMHGEEQVSYHHDKLEPILAETYGIIVYQEQIMQIASELFGYELGEADLMRRAVAKKKKKELDKHKAKFQKQGPKYGVPGDVAEQIFNDIEFFARYGFNKSHAADYAVLTVQTAFLKAHYPHEYMTALLTIERGDTDKVGGYIMDCRRMGIDVLPPDINASEHDFTIEQGADGKRSIRYGMSAIKNVGDGSVEAILDARSGGTFRDLEGMCERVDLRAVGKRALESLIKVGALDSMAEREKLLESLDRLMSYSSSLHKAAEAGQMSLFGEATGVELDTSTGGLLVDEVETAYSHREMLQWERDLVGVYISEHPLEGVLDKIDQVVNAYSSELTEADHERAVTMAGLVTYVRPHVTKTNKPMAFAGIEDLYGHIEVVVWPSTWDETRELWQEDRILLVRGKIDSKGGGEPKLLCDEATNNFDLWQAVDSNGDPIRKGNISPAYDPYDTYDEAPPPDDYDAYDDDPGVNLPPEPEFGPPPVEAYPTRGSNGGTQDQNGGAVRQEAIPTGETRNDVEPPANAEPSPQAEHPLPEAEAQTQVQTSAPEAPGEPLYEPPQRSTPVQKPEPSPRPPEVAADDRTCHVRLTLQRSDDPERDQRRLDRLYGTLISRPGKDSFSVIIEGETQRIEIDFPGKNIHYCAELVEQIAQIVGPSAVEVENR